MSITYTVTDSTGLVHTRTSRGHTAPFYTHAVVWMPGNAAKRYVTFSGDLALAKAALRLAQSAQYKGVATYPNAELIEVQAAPTPRVYKGKFPGRIRTVTFAELLVVFETNDGRWFEAEASSVVAHVPRSIGDMIGDDIADLPFAFQPRSSSPS